MGYIIGIDLGTTNSCVAYIDTKDVKAAVQLFKIPQLVAEGQVEALLTLPSFCYLAAPHEWVKGSISLPWQMHAQSQADFFVGAFARTQGAKAPTRLVQSAKSWLCHPAANRRDRILPLEAADEETRISPLEATARYLGHIRDAWNEGMAKGDPESDFDSQDIVLTVPASFDEVARTLTVEAARKAGFQQMTLLEEPQAAFYSWIAQHEDRWQQLLKVQGSYPCMRCRWRNDGFQPHRCRVKREYLSISAHGRRRHVLLGGDNMDAAIAYYIESKLAQKGYALNAVSDTCSCP